MAAPSIVVVAVDVTNDRMLLQNGQSVRWVAMPDSLADDIVDLFTLWAS